MRPELGVQALGTFPRSSLKRGADSEMKKNLIRHVVTAALVAVVSLVGTQSAHAAFIIGGISFSDGFDPGGVPGAPTTTIVSNLTSFNLNNAVNVYSPGSGTQDFATVASALASDVAPPPIPTTLYTTNNGFTFTVTTLLASASSPLVCNAQGLCNDSITLAIGGTVTGPAGFDPPPGSATLRRTVRASGLLPRAHPRALVLSPPAGPHRWSPRVSSFLSRRRCCCSAWACSGAAPASLAAAVVCLLPNRRRS